MELLIADMNWIAVGIGAVLAFLLGWLWYSPALFGKPWMEGVGLIAGDSDKSLPAMFVQGTATLLLSWAVGVTESRNIISLSVLMAFSFAALIKANGLYVGKSKNVILIEVGFVLAMMALLIAIHILI